MPLSFLLIPTNSLAVKRKINPLIKWHRFDEGFWILQCFISSISGPFWFVLFTLIIETSKANYGNHLRANFKGKKGLLEREVRERKCYSVSISCPFQLDKKRKVTEISVEAIRDCSDSSADVQTDLDLFFFLYTLVPKLGFLHFYWFFSYFDFIFHVVFNICCIFVYSDYSYESFMLH